MTSLHQLKLNCGLEAYLCLPLQRNKFAGQRLLKLFPEDDKRYEIIDGELFVTRAPHLPPLNGADAICSELRSWSKQSKASEAFTGVGLVFSETDNVIWISNKRLPINELKIDRSFIGQMSIDSLGNKKNLEIAETIATLAEKLGVNVTAEGIETAEQLAQLRALNCGYGQGYFFSQPLDAKSAEALMMAKPRW